ncbi:MAG TPA: hypothetical protein VK808_10750 [Bacteroidia bacterium]|jgi:hypothetical protein|nr:hypothetical protein [Bacteroidia bacterium]
MKKIKFVVAIIFLFSVAARAQFFNAIGLAAGISYGKEGWSQDQWATQEQYLLKFNAAVLAEFFEDPVYKWRSEIMYNQLGTKELVNEGKFVNGTTYISFNNYLKYQHEFFKFIPYLLIGPRVAYLFQRSPQIFGDVIGGMYTIHVSAAAGIGAELVSYSRFKPFIEFFYNHDIMPSFIGNTGSIAPLGNPLYHTVLSETIMAHDYELRIGIKYHIKGQSKCPAVINPAGNPAGAE